MPNLGDQVLREEHRTCSTRQRGSDIGRAAHLLLRATTLSKRSGIGNVGGDDEKVFMLASIRNETLCS